MKLPTTSHKHIAEVMRDLQGYNTYIPGPVPRFDGLQRSTSRTTEPTSLDLAVIPSALTETIDTGLPPGRKHPRDDIAAPIAIYEPAVQAPFPFRLRALNPQPKKLPRQEERATTPTSAVCTTTDSSLHPHSAIDVTHTTTSTKPPLLTRPNNLSTAHIFLRPKSRSLASRAYYLEVLPGVWICE